MKQPVYAPGTIVAGRYRIDKAIARGGCSIVYRGTHIEMARSVALKIMSAGEGVLDRAWTQRFQREAQLASQLRHPNTIIIYDYGHDQGLWFIAMEWVEGASLRNEIKDRGPIEPARCARLTIQMLKSLTEAHRQHILHRDLKPSNIMLTRDMDGGEIVKVLDFGLAKAEPKHMSAEQLKLTREGDFVGTPRYASPEQLRGHRLTPAADIYGVGMVMWEMLTGRPAVPQIDYATCVQYHLGPNPWMLPPAVYPPGLATIVEKALIKDPTRRFQSCDEMISVLDAWLRSETNTRVQLFDDEPDMLAGGGFDARGGRPLGRHDTPIDHNARRPQSPHNPPTQPVPPRQASPPAHRESHEGNGNFASLDAANLELDRTVSPKPTNTAPNQAVRPPSSGASPARPARGGSSRLPLVLGGALLGVLVLGAIGFYAMSSKDGGEGDPVESNETTAAVTTPEETRELSPGELNAQMETRNPKDLLLLVRREGWFYSEPETTSLAGVKQTTLRLKKDRATVDMTFYECDSLALARDFEDNTKRPAEAMRFGLTVLRMIPVGHFGGTGVSELRKQFLVAKGMVNPN